MSEQGSGASAEGPDEIGSVAQEATKLLGAVADWAREHGSDLGAGVAALADQAAASAHEINAHLATDDPECRYCPVCRTVHAVRSASPEVRAQLLHARSHLIDVRAELLEVLHLRLFAFAGGRAELHLVLALTEHGGVGLADRSDGGRHGERCGEQAQRTRELSERRSECHRKTLPRAYDAQNVSGDCGDDVASL